MLNFLLYLLFLSYYSVCRDSSEGKIVEEFLEAEGVDESKKIKILSIIKGMGEFLLGSLFTFLDCSSQEI